MIPATIQQLDVVSRKATKLEQQVSTNIETLKAARTERDDAERRVAELRQMLATEEVRAERAHTAHSRAEVTLRASAQEYSKAQLLQKRLANTLKELQGFNRSIVIAESGCSVISSFPPSSSSEGMLRVADVCTIHAPTARKTIVVDSVVAPNTLSAAAAEATPNSAADADGFGGPSAMGLVNATTNALQIPSLVGEALSGFNLSIMTVGPKGAGKTSSTWGIVREELLQSALLGMQRGGGGLHNAMMNFNISPHNAATRNVIGDPTGFLLAKYFKGVLGAEGVGTDGGAASSSFTLGSASSPLIHDANGASSASSSPSSSTALVPLFMHHLFCHFATYDVTHFSIKVSFVELVADGTVDLLLGGGGGGNWGAAEDTATMPIGFAADNADDDEGGNGNSNYHTATTAAYQASQRATCVQVKSEEAFYETLTRAFAMRNQRLVAQHQQRTMAMMRRGGGAAGGRSASSMTDHGGNPTATSPSLAADLLSGHLAMTVQIENFNSRGNFRRSTVLFTDVAGGITSSTTSAAGQQQQQTAEQQWAAKGAWALTDVISMASAAVTNAMEAIGEGNGGGSASFAAGAHGSSNNVTSSILNANNASTAAHSVLANTTLPHQTNRLVQLVKSTFGGNAKGVLCCVIPSLNGGASTCPTALNGDNGDGDADEVSQQQHDQHMAATRILPAALNALAYAHYFKNTCHNAVPFDIPPELQQLTREVDEGFGYYDEDRGDGSGAEYHQQYTHGNHQPAMDIRETHGAYRNVSRYQ